MNYGQYAGYVRMRELPEGLDVFFDEWKDDGRRALCDHDFFRRTLKNAGADERALRRMEDALAAVEQDETLFAFSRFLVSDLCAARNRCDCDEYLSLDPGCLTGDARALYALTMMIACVETSTAALKARGVPEEYYADIPGRRLKPQIDKLNAGDPEIADFPWDLNFYTCAIFFLDRFYFIPFRYNEAPAFYRSAETNEVTALWRGEGRIRRDGQLDGVNGVCDDFAFEPIWQESEQAVTAYPVLPAGLIGRAPVTLQKAIWKDALPKDSLLLALHIPGGEGYEPKRVRSSMLRALDFFGEYFPELNIRGFWSESWLYDPGLRALLPGGGHIVSVQKQFYCYPTGEGEEQIKIEVFGDESPDLSAPGKTSLQRKLLAAWREGAHFHATGMVVLREETDRIGQSPYQKA